MLKENERYVDDPWMNCMMKGEWEEAWKISDAALKERTGKPCWHLPRHQQYIWNGATLEGKRVLVRCYHGLGDTIQFIRYMPLVKEVAREVLVWAQPQLIPLLKTVHGIDRLLPLHDGTPEVDYNVDVEIMELSHVFRSTIATLPKQIPYLHVEPATLSSDKKTLAVGLVWKAGNWDQRRNIPFQLLTSLFDVPNVTIYILQGQAREAGWIEGMGEYVGEVCLYEYPKRIAALDLLISIDSMPVHLAGALGKPVWNLLHADADWRWMRNRDDSPWYPTMHLFRQKVQGEWEPVIDQVKTELHKLAATKAVTQCR